MLDTRGMTGAEADRYCTTILDRNMRASLPCENVTHALCAAKKCGDDACIMCCAAHEQGRGTTQTLHDVMLSALRAARDELRAYAGGKQDDLDTERVLVEVNAAIVVAESEENHA